MSIIGNFPQGSSPKKVIEATLSKNSWTDMTAAAGLKYLYTLNITDTVAYSDKTRVTWSPGNGCYWACYDSGVVSLNPGFGNGVLSNLKFYAKTKPSIDISIVIMIEEE